jgi:hypothetical protein
VAHVKTLSVRRDYRITISAVDDLRIYLDQWLSPSKPVPRSGIDSLLALMTLEEKLGQLNQPTGPANQTGPAARAGSIADIRAGRIGSFLGVYGAAYTREFQRVAVEESRLRIPLLFAHDVIQCPAMPRGSGEVVATYKGFAGLAAVTVTP